MFPAPWSLGLHLGSASLAPASAPFTVTPRIINPANNKSGGIKNLKALGGCVGAMLSAGRLCRVQAVLTTLLTIIACQDLHDFLGLNEPFFNHSQDVVFTAQEGGMAYLSCEVFNLNNKSVSWVRTADSHILTVDRETFISDRRFLAMHRRAKMSDTVTLSIHAVRRADQGAYECQVSAEQKIAKAVELVVLVPQVRILGDPDIHVNEGSSLRLKCIISNIVEAPQFVTWFLNGKVGGSPLVNGALEIINNGKLFGKVKKP